MTTGPIPKPWIAGIHAYVPGKSAGADGRALVKLSANENPLGCSPKALAARTPRRFTRRSIPMATAPRCAKLWARSTGSIRRGSSWAPVRASCSIWPRSGYAGPGDEVLFSQYSFSLYDIVARRCGAQPVEAARATMAPMSTRCWPQSRDRTRVVIVANPNNPTGTYLPRSEIARLHAGLPADVLLVLDQAYAEYVDPTATMARWSLRRSMPTCWSPGPFPRPMVSRESGSAGAPASAAVIDILNRMRGAFNISNEAQAMALEALADQDFVEHSRRHNAARCAPASSRAVEALGNHGMRMVPSEANFVLVLFEGALSGEAAYKGLAEAGYITRWLPTHGLPQRGADHHRHGRTDGRHRRRCCAIWRRQRR
jgi:histidinol-phosphate aminotransferase